MEKKLPKIIYVRWAKYQDDDPFLEADIQQFGHAEMGETRLVGTYELKEMKWVTGIAKIE